MLLAITMVPTAAPPMIMNSNGSAENDGELTATGDIATKKRMR